MPRQVEFWFDVGSPAAYLAWAQLPRHAADTGGEVVEMEGFPHSGEAIGGFMEDPNDLGER